MTALVRVCGHCAAPLRWRARADAIYCGGACRVAAHRRRAHLRLEAVSQPVEVTDHFGDSESITSFLRVYQVDYGRERRCANIDYHRHWQAQGMFIVADPLSVRVS